MIQLLLGQGLARSTGKHFSPAEWDVVHVSEIGMSTSTDREILEAGHGDKSRDVPFAQYGRLWQN